MLALENVSLGNALLKVGDRIIKHFSKAFVSIRLGATNALESKLILLIIPTGIIVIPFGIN